MQRICKNCLHLNLSKAHLGQGICNYIVQVGTLGQYKSNKLTLAAGQKAGIISEELTSYILVANDFSCSLFKDKNENITNKSEEVPTKVSMGSKETKPIVPDK